MEKVLKINFVSGKQLFIKVPNFILVENIVSGAIDLSNYASTELPPLRRDDFQYRECWINAKNIEMVRAVTMPND